MICVLPYLLTTHTEAIGRFQPGGQEGAQCVLIAGHSPGMRRQSTIACVIGILLSEGRAGGERREGYGGELERRRRIRVVEGVIGVATHRRLQLGGD